MICLTAIRKYDISENRKAAEIPDKRKVLLKLHKSGKNGQYKKRNLL